MMKKSDIERLYDAAIELEKETPSDISFNPFEDSELMSKLVASFVRLQRAEIEYLFNINQNTKEAGDKYQMARKYVAMLSVLLRFGIAHKIDLDSILRQKATSSEL